MKKDSIILTVAVLAYSFLFFQQSAGINFIIFNILLLILQLIIRPHLRKEKAWVLVALSSLITAVNIAWQHTTLALIAHLISMVVLAGFSLHPNISFLMAALNAVYSFAGSIMIKIADYFNQGKTKTSQPHIGSSMSLKLMVPPLLTAIFFFIYRAANPAFKAITDMLFEGWVTTDWFIFTFVGFLLLFGFFHQVAIDTLTQQDMDTTDGLIRKKSGIKRLFKLPALKTEYQLGWISFALLNGLLLFVNLTDAYYLLIARSLPDGIIYSEYVHQGVYTLIFSILLAIAVILYFFRGNLNFYKQNQKLSLLAYGWIIQNILLLVTTAGKTSVYVAEYSLTHKRIGVFIYLLLTAIGLVITFLKINKIKNNWFLFRKASWAFYVVLITATFINWDRFITQYTLKHFSNFSQVDINYLINLSDANVAQLTELLHTSPEKLTENQKIDITRKKQAFLYRVTQTEWQSWNYDDAMLTISVEP